MLVKRVYLESLTNSLFTRSFYKRGNFIEHYSYDYIPQSVLYGALAFAINRVLQQDLEIIDKLHVTTAPRACFCLAKTFFLTKEKSVCPQHSEISTKHNLLIHSVPLMPARFQPLMIDYKGMLDTNRRFSMRKAFPLAHHQPFSFIVFAEDEHSAKTFDDALNILCYEIKQRSGVKKGLGLGIGWGKKLGWGCFRAEHGKWSQVEKVGRTFNIIVRAQSPVTSTQGTTLTLDNVVELDARTFNTIVRNIHYKEEQALISAYVEGSELLVREKVDYYATDDRDWAIGFSNNNIFRRFVTKHNRIKALEGSYLARRTIIEQVS